MEIIYETDLLPFCPDIDSVKARAMIDDALAMAARVAPCILDPDFAYVAAAKAILRGAIIRWNEAGSGAVVQQAVGPFSQSMDTRQTRRGMFWPSEINDLAALCAASTEGRAFSVDTMPSDAGLGVYGVDYWWSTPSTTGTL